MEAAALQGETTGGGGMGRRGAHLKHAVHARDARRVESQRQVERGRALPSPKGGMLRGRQETGGRGGGGLSDAQRGPDWGVGGTGRRGAHVKHVPHVRDVGRVEAQRLVERIRALPRFQRQAQHEVDALGQETEGR